MLLKTEDRPLDQVYQERLRGATWRQLHETIQGVCFMANPFNPAIWTRYAQNHTRCLLGFKHLPQHDTPLQAAKQLTYH